MLAILLLIFMMVTGLIGGIIGVWIGEKVDNGDFQILPVFYGLFGICAGVVVGGLLAAILFG